MSAIVIPVVRTAGGRGDADTRAEWPSARAAWTALVLLMLGVFLSCLDRSIVTLLVEPIKADFGLNDTQFGALQSLITAIGMPVMVVCMLLARRPYRLLCKEASA